MLYLSMAKSKIFWDIEKERTTRIYTLFGSLLLFYFVSVYSIWLIVKFFIYIRQFIEDPHTPYSIFGTDTLLVLLIAFIVAVVHWYYSNKNVVNKILGLLGAKYADKYDTYHYMFQNVVDEIEASAGGIHVERCVLPTGAMNAFALADLSGRKVIGITEGLLSRLTRDEIQAVVAHEMAHIVSNDCLQTTMACSLFSIYSEGLAQFNRVLKPHESVYQSSVASTQQRNAMAYVALSVPVIVILFVMDILGDFIHMFISREREYRADANAVKLTRNPLSLARALYKIGTHWRGAGYGGERLSPIFILSPEYKGLDEIDNVAATLFSTHPPLRKRLRVLLNIAHADMTLITEQIQKSNTVKTEAEIKTPIPRFHIEHNHKWLGPFTIIQLMTLDWLIPESNVRMAGNNNIITANDIPALNHFFKTRDEPIWKMKRLCPLCRQWLIAQEYEGSYVWRCAFCNGILTSQEKLPRIFVRKEKGFTENIQRCASLLRKDAQKKKSQFQLLFPTAHPRPCPKCGKPMVRKFYSYAYHVEIDECLRCKLIWFDADELEILQCLIEMEDKN
jgi:heat shock protein HtpX